MQEYEFYGWRVRSSFELGAAGEPLTDRRPDILLEMAREPTGISWRQPPGEVLAEFPPGESPWKMYWLTGKEPQYLLRLPGRADLKIDFSTRQVYCRRAPDFPVEHLAEFFSGNIMALLLGLAGEAAFHASAVGVRPLGEPRRPHRAVAIVGGSGAGKSTTAALMVAAGAMFVTDDLLRVCPGDEGPMVVGGCPEIRLRESAWPLRDVLPLAPARATADNRVALTLGQGQSTCLPLGLILFPRPSAQFDKPQFRPMSRKEAAFRLAASPRMTGWRSPSVLEAQFSCLSGMVNSTAAVEVQVPAAPMPSVPQSLESLATQLVEGAASFFRPA